MKIFHWIGTGNLPKEPGGEALSGVTKAALKLAEAQTRLGHNVTVGSAGTVSWKMRWHGMNLVSLKVAPWAVMRWNGVSYDLRQHIPLALYLERHFYDVIHMHLYYYMRFLRAQRKIVHFHADPLDSNSSLTDADWTGVIKYSHGAIAVSNYVVGRVREGVPNKEWPVIPILNGVDSPMEGKKSISETASELRKKLGIGTGDFVFLYAGAIAQVKGVHVLAQTFMKMAARLPNIHLLLAGSSHLWDGALGHVLPTSFESSIHQTLEPLQALGRVHYLGSVPSDDMPTVYRAADTLVVPSIWNEALGLVVLESIAAGVPVIASRVGGIPEIINEETGILVEPNNACALETAMNDMVTQSGLHEFLRSHCEFRAKKFSWRRAAEESLNFYESIH